MSMGALLFWTASILYCRCLNDIMIKVFTFCRMRTCSIYAHWYWMCKGIFRSRRVKNEIELRISKNSDIQLKKQSKQNKDSK